MYSSAFCKIYNEFGWNAYPEVFADRLLQWLQEAQIPVKTCMDLACGTGILTAETDTRTAAAAQVSGNRHHLRLDS